jgi:CRP-like cAMP-binding protein
MVVASLSASSETIDRATSWLGVHPRREPMPTFETAAKAGVGSTKTAAVPVRAARGAGGRETGRAPPATEPMDAERLLVFRALAVAPVFRCLPPPRLLALSRTARCRWFEPGALLAPELADVLPQALSESASVLVVAAGWCIATRSLPDGRWSIVGLSGPGQIAGLERLQGGLGSPRPPGRANRQGFPRRDLPAWKAAGWVSGVRVPVALLRLAVRTSPDARDELDAMAGERIAELETALAERCLEARERVYRTLLRLALRYGTSVERGWLLDLRLTQTELAVLAGTTRETVNRALRTLSAEGILTLTEGRPFVVRTEGIDGRRVG